MMPTSVSLPARVPRPGLSGTALKRLACLSMLLDHIGASCLEAGILTPNGVALTLFAPPPAGTPAGLQSVYWCDAVLRLIGRLAFPIYCFLLVEGFTHTHSRARYALRLTAFALLSEVPFDAAFFRTLCTPYYQNVYFTLLLGLVCLMLLQRCEGDGFLRALARVGAVLLCGGAALLLHTDYDFFGVAFIALLYLLRGRPRLCTAAGCLALAWEVTAPLAFLPIRAYNGRRGRCPAWEQYAFYLFYPAHLTLLALITNFLLVR